MDIYNIDTRKGNIPVYQNKKNKTSNESAKIVDDFVHALSEEDSQKKNLESESTEDKEQESETSSNVVVNADGSRVLVMTMKIGGMETQMSMELSKPDKLQDQNTDISVHMERLGVNKVGAMLQAVTTIE